MLYELGRPLSINDISHCNRLAIDSALFEPQLDPNYRLSPDCWRSWDLFTDAPLCTAWQKGRRPSAAPTTWPMPVLDKCTAFIECVNCVRRWITSIRLSQFAGVEVVGFECPHSDSGPIRAQQYITAGQRAVNEPSCTDFIWRLL